jgi:hypothetical protein
MTTRTISIILGSKKQRIMLYQYESRTEYRERWKYSLPRSRGNCYVNRKRRGYLCRIHYVAGDLENLLHELHHAACEAVRRGCTAKVTLSRKCYEERVATATGVIGAAVLLDLMQPAGSMSFNDGLAQRIEQGASTS